MFVLFFLNLNAADSSSSFYPTDLKSCRGLFSPMVSRWAGMRSGGRVAGRSLSELYLRNRRVKEVDTW